VANIQERIDSEGNKTYRVRIRLKGHPMETATFERRTDAKDWAIKKEAAIKEGRHSNQAEAKRHTFREAIERYRRDVLPRKAASSRASEESRLRWWEEQLGDYTLDKITPARLTECRDRLLNEGSGYTAGRHPGGQGLSPTTVSKYIRQLSHLFNIAIREWQWLVESPMERVAKPQNAPGRVRFLDDDERERFLAVCRESGNPYLYTTVVVSISTGLRRGELFRLTWDRVDLEKGVIRLEAGVTKTRRSRAVPLEGHALALMQELYKNRTLVSKLCFPSFQNPRQPYDMRRPFRQALKKAEITDFTWHDMRHCCASYLLMNGATLGEVAEVLGHRTLDMVKRYAHIAESHTRRVVGSMNARIFKSS